VDGTISVALYTRFLDAAFEERPKQVGKIEEIVSDTWLNEFGGSFDRVAFNVPVWVDPPPLRDAVVAPTGSLVGPEPYRIDIIGQIGEEVELIEVKEIGNMTAIGQLLTYRMLFQMTYFGVSVIHLRLVCSSCRKAIELSCRENGINLDQVYDQADSLIKAARRGG